MSHRTHCAAGLLRTEHKQGKRPSPVTTERNRELVKAWREGIPPAELAQRYGISVGRANAIVGAAREAERRTAKIYKADVVAVLRELEAAIDALDRGGPDALARLDRARAAARDLLAAVRRKPTVRGVAD